MQEKMKEPRIFMCLAIWITGFLPWMTMQWTATEEFYEIEETMSSTLTGFELLEYSFWGIVIFGVPIVLIIMEFLPQIDVKMTIFYLMGSCLGIVMSILTIFICKTNEEEIFTSSDYMEMEIKNEVTMKIGFWLSILLFLVILGYTLIKDYAVSKEAIVNQGIKGTFSEVADNITKELSENIGVLSSVSEMGNGMIGTGTYMCPSCGTNVMKGKKFCAKCGTKIPEIEEKPSSNKMVLKGKGSKMITVNEYIKSLKSVSCENCGGQVPINSKFCPNCGEEVIIKMVFERCENCGGEILRDKKFCPDCGSAIVKKELKTNCERCNAELLYGKKYCVECGVKIE